MSKTHRKKTLVDQMVNYLEQSNNSSYEEDESRKEKQSKSVQLFNNNNNVSERSIVMVKKEKNFHRRIFNVLPQLEHSHIDLLFGFISINQKAIEDPGFEQSFLYSYMQARTIERVEVFQHAIVFEMTQPNNQNEPPVQYLVEKYRSKGRMDYYEMSLMIEQLTWHLKSMGPPVAQTQQLVKKYLDFLGDNMYLGLFGPRKVVISKALLTYLDYDIQQVLIQATKYRSLLIEITSSINYTMGIKQLLKFFKHTAQLTKGQISPEDYKELTTYRFCDYIHSRFNVSSYCEMRFYQLTPNNVIHQIDKIIYKETSRKKAICSTQMDNAVKEEKEKIKQAQYRTLSKIRRLPKGLFLENRSQMAGYKQCSTNGFSSKKVQKQKQFFVEQ